MDGNSDDNLVTFWEPLTGQQFRFKVGPRLSNFKLRTNVGGAASHPFRQLFCLIRGDRLLINLQPLPSLPVSGDCNGTDRLLSLDLQNPDMWSVFPNPHWARLRHPAAGVMPPSPPLRDPLLVEESLQRQVVGLITSLRRDRGLAHPTIDAQVGLFLSLYHYYYYYYYYSS